MTDIGPLLIALGFCLPFIGFPEKVGLIPTTFAESLTVALFGASALAYASILSVRATPVHPLATGALLALAAPAVWHWVNGTGAAPYFAYTALIAALLLGFGIQFGRMIAASGLRDRTVTSAATGVVAGSLITFGLQAMQGAGLARDLPQWVAGVSKLSCGLYGNLAQSNHAAMYLAVGALGSLHLFNRGILRPVSLVAIQVALMLAIGLTGSRMGLVAAAFVTVVAFLPQSREAVLRGLRFRPGWTVAACMVGGLLFAFWLGPLLESPCVSSLHRALDSDGSVARSDKYRLELLQRSIAAASVRPWSGIGPGNFAGFTYQAANPLNGDLLDYNAHNLIAQIAAELGLPAAIMLGGMICWWLWSTRRAWVSDVTFRFTGGAVVLLLFHSLLEYPLWYAYFLLPFALLVGLGTPQALSSSRGAISTSLLRTFGIVLVIGAVAVSVDYTRQVKAWNIVRSLVDEQRHASFGEMIDFQRQIAGTFFRPYAELNELRMQDFALVRTGDREILNKRLINVFPEQDLMAREIELAIRDRDRTRASYHVHRVRLFKPRAAEQLLEDVRDALKDDLAGTELLDQVTKAPQ